jgi:hypothetical protein
LHEQALTDSAVRVSSVTEESKLEISDIGKPDSERGAPMEGSQTKDYKADSSVEETLNSLPDLTGLITRENLYPSAFGGFADVWIGTWNKKTGPCKVRNCLL